MQHLIGFRRALLARDSVRFEYTTQGITDTLRYDRDGFRGDTNTTARKLRELYCADDIRTVKFMDGGHDPYKSIPVAHAVITSLNGFQPDNNTIDRMMRFLRRFPPVIVKLAPLNRAKFEDFSLYLLLHQQVILNGKCDLAAFVNEAGEEQERLRRLRVFLACFCLGLIVPYKNKASNSKNASVLQRIIQRVRKL